MESGLKKRKAEEGEAVEERGESGVGPVAMENAGAALPNVKHRHVKKNKSVRSGDPTASPSKHQKPTSNPTATFKPIPEATLPSSSRVATSYDPNPFSRNAKATSELVIKSSDSLAESEDGERDGEDIGPASAPGLHKGEVAEMDLKEAVRLNKSLKEQIENLKKQMRNLPWHPREAVRKVTAAEAQAADCLKAKDEAVDRLRRHKGQIKQANLTVDSLRDDLRLAKNSIAYLEKLLAFEELSGYSSMVCDLQLE